MLKLRCTLRILALATFCVLGAQKSALAVEVNDVLATVKPYDAPVTEFKSETGEVVSLKQFEGQVVVLNFWATWCPPCVEELPSLVKLQEKMAAEKLKVIALSIDSKDIASVQAFLVKNKIANVPLYFDEKNALYKASKLRGVPTSFVIDAKGQVVARAEGDMDWAAPEVVNYLKKLLPPTMASAQNN